MTAPVCPVFRVVVAGRYLVRIDSTDPFARGPAEARGEGIHLVWRESRFISHPAVDVEALREPYGRGQ